MPLLRCVLTLLPEHLLLASSGVRLLLVSSVCCWLFPPLVCRGSSVILTPRSPVVAASPLLKCSWQGQTKALFPAHDATGKMRLEVSGAYCRVAPVCFRERKALALLREAY